MNSTKWSAITAGIALVTAWLYWPAMGFPYVWDDWVWLGNIQRFQGSILELAFLEPFLTGNKYWRPLGEISLYLQIGSNPASYQHAINVLLHLINLALLSLFGWHAFQRHRQSCFPALWLVLLAVFALHPIFVEPVVWVSGRFDLLFTTFLLGCLGCYWLIKDSRMSLCLVVLCYVGALLVKETAILILPMLLLFGHILKPATSLGELIKRDRVLVLVLVIISVGYLIARAAVLGDFGVSLLFSEKQPLVLHEKAYEILATIGLYFQLSVLPFVDVSTLHPTREVLANPLYAIIGGVYLALTGILLRRQGRARTAGLILLGFLLSLALVLNIIPEGFTDNIAQNRYLYPSLAFVLCCLAVSRVDIALTPLAKKTLAGLAVLWLALAGLNIKITVPLWQSQEVLTAWIVTQHPDSTYAVNLRGMHHLDAGELERAIEVVGPEAARNPTWDGYMVLALAHFGLGVCSDALVYYEYAHMLGHGPQQIDALVGQYQIHKAMNPDKLEELRQRIEKHPGVNSSHLEKLSQIDQMQIDCRK